jgi:predicted HTH transcriptional regulator
VTLISDRIAPRLLPEIEILPWRKTQVLAVQVHPSPSRPHYLVREGLAGGAYVRVGSTNRRADSEMIGELRRFAHGEDAIAFVQKHTLYGAEIGPVRRKEHWSLPPVALREVVINGAQSCGEPIFDEMNGVHPPLRV